MENLLYHNKKLLRKYPEQLWKVIKALILLANDRNVRTEPLL